MAPPTARHRLGLLATAVVAAVLMVVSVGASVGQIWGGRGPAIARRFWLSGSRAQAGFAALQVANQPTRARLREAADAVSRAALSRDPTDVVAIRTRGLIAGLDGHTALATRWMEAAETVSRRDMPTQLWLIENAVGHGDIGRALIHYDRALRTSDAAPDLLFPVLIAASVEPQVADKLSRLLATRPTWWGLFMNRLIGETTQPGTLPIFARRLRLSPNDPAHPDFFGRTLQRLVAADAFGDADRLYRSVALNGSALLHDGDFEHDDGVQPFAWRLADEDDLVARVEPRPDGAAGSALVLDARNGRSGEVAAQAVALTPGRYRLRGIAAQVGGDEAARPVVVLRCGSLHPADLVRSRLPQAGTTPVTFTVDFVVPAACPGVWIGIDANAGLGGDAARPWLDQLAVTRTTGEGG